MRRVIAAMVVVMTWTAGAAAQGKVAVDEALVQRLMERIDKLEKRVAELEAPGAKLVEAQGAPVAPQAAVTPAGGMSSPDHDQVMTAGASEVEKYPSLKVRGFGDIDFSSTDRPGTKSGFNMGQLVLHLASPLSKKVSFFGEISFTAQPTLYNVDVERAIIRFDYNDLMRLSFGRYHTPVNYWNTAFHHGSWLQTTISRPDMIQFGGRFIPVHFIGALAEGNVPSGALGLGYSAGFGNGRASIISRAGDQGDANNNRAFVATLYSRPQIMNGLQLGGSVYRDEVSPAAGGNFGEWIASAHIALTRETPEILAEWANVHHRNKLTGKTTDNQGFYAQIAYRLPVWERRMKPYFRYDYIQLDPGEQVYTDVLNARGATLGMRFDVTDFAAFKSEYRNTSPPKAGLKRVNGVFLQTSFTF